jgi:hypothetical protein
MKPGQDRLRFDFQWENSVEGIARGGQDRFVSVH